MNDLKAKFVTTELTELLKAMDNKIHSCTYAVNDNGEEIVTVWDNIYGEPNCGLQVYVTADSLAQLTIDVIKKVIM